MSKGRLIVFNEFLQRFKEASAMYQQQRSRAWKEQLNKSESKLKQIFFEQTELVQKQSDLLNRACNDISNLRERAEKAEQQNKHYLKYLEEIADVKHGWNPLAIEARIAIESVYRLEGLDCED